jgi:hypothetical protein
VKRLSAKRTASLHDQTIQFEEDRFGITPEIIAKLARTSARIYELGISYNGGAYREGKKINWKDGLGALMSWPNITAVDNPLQPNESYE